MCKDNIFLDSFFLQENLFVLENTLAQQPIVSNITMESSYAGESSALIGTGTGTGSSSLTLKTTQNSSQDNSYSLDQASHSNEGSNNHGSIEVEVNGRHINGNKSNSTIHMITFEKKKYYNS